MKHRRRKRIKKNSDSSDDDGEKGAQKKHGRKNIRKMIRSSDLEIETKEAAKREIERKKRIEERQKLVCFTAPLNLFNFVVFTTKKIIRFHAYF